MMIVGGGGGEKLGRTNDSDPPSDHVGKSSDPDHANDEFEHI